VLRSFREIAKSDYQLRHVCLSDYLSICPHGKLGYHWMEFHETLYLNAFSKHSEKKSSFIKIYKNNEYFT
jgi:hypothetical protein